MSDETRLLAEVARFRLNIDGTVTVRDLAEVVAVCRPAYRQPAGRLERAVRSWLDARVRDGALVRNDRGGRNGAHEYAPSPRWSFTWPLD